MHNENSRAGGQLKNPYVLLALKIILGPATFRNKQKTVKVGGLRWACFVMNAGFSNCNPLNIKKRALKMNLEAFTKKELMEYARDQGARPPATLRKTDIITYLKKFDERSRMFETMKSQ